MRIILFTDTFPPEINGVATSTYNLMNVLKKNGHEVFVVCTNPYGKKTTFDGTILRIPGIELKKLYSYRLSSFYNSKAMRIIIKLKPDIIHVQTDAGIGVFGRRTAKKLKIPLVYTYHTMYEDYTYYVTKGKKLFDIVAKSVVRKYSRFMAEKNTEFIAPSNKTKEIMRNYGVESYINVVPSGIDFEKYLLKNIDEKKLQEIKNNLNLQGFYTILSLGRVAKEKSIDICIKGFNKLLKSTKKVKMVIVGGGPDLENLQNLVKELKIEDYVVFVGPVSPDDVAYYYHSADLFVSASITETQGLTFMESMAARTLVLAKYDGNLADVIIDNETGFYFEDEDDFAIKAQRIISLSKSKQDEIKDKALKQIEHYSIDKFYTNIMEVYKRAERKYW